MQKRQLGAGGPMVGAIGLGCMSFSGIYGTVEERQAHAVLDRAAELGMTLMDTANIYGDGRSEEMLGSWLKANPGHGFTICSKGSIITSPKRDVSNDPAYLRQCLEASLRRLGVEHIDLYYIHRRETGRPVAEIMETLVRFQEEGKIGGIGFSEIAPSTLVEACEIAPVMAVQSEYSLWTRAPELGMIQACKRLGVAFVPFSPLARGAIGDRPLDVAALSPKEFRTNNPRFTGDNWVRNAAALARFAEFARKAGHAPATLAIAWTMAKGDHLIPIPGTASVPHLEQDAAAASLALSDSDLAAIEDVLPAGFAFGSRYSPAQWASVEEYC